MLRISANGLLATILSKLTNQGGRGYQRRAFGKAKCAISTGTARPHAQISHAPVSSPAINYYFERFGFCPPQIAEPPHPDLGMVVVVPCFNEPNLLVSLESLWRCQRPSAAVEVIVVINSSETASAEVLEQNRRTVGEATAWVKEHCYRYFRVHWLHFPQLPRKQAGVGLARKIGMDEALRRFDAVKRLGGVILCFDADSQCEANYLVEVEKHFSAFPKRPGCSIYFEHPLEGAEDPRIYEAITLYELHLRYYVEGLRFAGFPHAFHTIGSSMAVRAGAYMQQGGMNKRQAGEDFYFLHKIIPVGNFGEVITTRVIPSPRPSERVPFGTGRAVRDYLASGQFETYPLQAFHDLKALFQEVPNLRHSGAAIANLPAAMQAFLEREKAELTLEEIRANTSTEAAFQKRFFRWLDGFLAMKFIHHARDTAYGAAQVTNAASELLRAHETDPPELLRVYRNRQRQRSIR
jgi:glycosyltransferase involved in cell wall biosynthesis